MAAASTINKHFVLVGSRHLGYRAAQIFYSLGGDVLVVKIDSAADKVATTQDPDIPNLADDGNREAAIPAIGVQKTRLYCDALRITILTYKLHQMTPCFVWKFNSNQHTSPKESCK